MTSGNTRARCILSQPPLRPAVLGRGKKLSAASSDSSGLFDFSQAESRGEDIRFSANEAAGIPDRTLECRGRPYRGLGGFPRSREMINRRSGCIGAMIRLPARVMAKWCSKPQKGLPVSGIWATPSRMPLPISGRIQQADKPTTNTSGMIGDAQEFGANKILVIRPPGVGPDRRTCMPSGNADRTISAWVKPTSFEGLNWAQASIGGWGEPERGQKPNMGLSYFTMTGRGQPDFISTALTQGAPASCPVTNGDTLPLPFPGTWSDFTSMAFKTDDQ